jgi:hypothetical protein
VRYGTDGSSRLFGETPAFASGGAGAGGGAGSAAPASGGAAPPTIRQLMDELGISFETAAALVDMYPANKDLKNDDTPMVYTPLRNFIKTFLGEKIVRLEESQRAKYVRGDWLINLTKRLEIQENSKLAKLRHTNRYAVPQSSFKYKVLVFIIKDLNSEIERLIKEGRVTSGGAGAAAPAASGGAGGPSASGGAGAAAPPKPKLRIPAANYNSNNNLGGGYRRSKRSKSRSQKRSKSRKSQKKSRSRR